MTERNWKLKETEWATSSRGIGYRYIPVKNTAPDGSTWEVARVWVDEDDHAMLDDARLIEAAPELFSTLKRLLEICGRSPRANVDDYLAALNAATAAVNKAEGNYHDSTTHSQDHNLD